MRRAPIVSWTTKGKVWIDPKKELKYDIQQGAPVRRYPTSAIMCYQEPMISIATERFHARKADRLLGNDFYEDPHSTPFSGVNAKYCGLSLLTDYTSYTME